MISNRLELALERLQPSDWNRFERLASVFLATEFDELRTVASPSGDEGRDAELFSTASEPNVVIQYSVSADWRGKINATARRLNKTIPNALILIYITNQVIGAGSDSLKKTLRAKQGLTLDIRDRHWFLERVFESTGRQQAAEELARVIVDPNHSPALGPTSSQVILARGDCCCNLLGSSMAGDARKGLTKIALKRLSARRW